MLETVAVIIVIILCAMGAVELIRSVVFAFLTPERGKEFIVLVTGRSHDESLEYMLRCARSRARWFRGRSRVICLDYGMDEESEAMCEQMENVERLTPEELCRQLYAELQSEEESDIIEEK